MVTAGAAGAIGGAAALVTRFGRFATRPPQVAASASATPIALPQSLRGLTAPEYLVVAAASERIFPRDNAPGAIDLGVPLYVDRSLAESPAPSWADGFRAGLTRLDAESSKRFGMPFHQAQPPEQDSLLAQWEGQDETLNGKFFHNLVAATLEGALGDPAYGGNLDAKGWASLGMPVDPFVPLKRAKTL
jgi:hypothetical protein